MTSITPRNRLLVVWRGMRRLWLILLWIVAAEAQGNWRENNPPLSDPALLIRRACQNEVQALERPAEYQQYFERLEWSWGTETRAVIETQEGRADRIVEFNDDPLSREQQAQQERRLKKLLSDRGAQKNEQKEERQEVRRRVRMMNAFPQAFLFEPQGEMEEGTMKFSFRPNPKFSPGDRETQIFRGMQGTVWLDAEHEMLMRIEGVVSKDVSFAWGILGKLRKGGKFEIAQEQVKPGVWRITRLDLDLRGRMVLRGFRLLRRERNADFETAPAGMTYEEALELLLKSPSGPARHGNSGRPGALHGRSN